jgi:GNAT superfamily N-acetyltransferase
VNDKNDYTIRSFGLDRHEIEAAAAMHCDEIRGGFLSSLGSRALQPVYTNAVESQHGALVIGQTVHGAEVCGFLLGTLDTRAFYSDLLRRHWLTCVRRLLLRVLNPKKAWRLLETLKYGGSRPTHMPAAELLAMAVAEDHRGSGVAAQLFEEFSSVLAVRHVPRFAITVGGQLSRAQTFYEKMGARLAGSIVVHRGEEANVYVCDTQSREPQQD